jgi:hypothetical protein
MKKSIIFLLLVSFLADAEPKETLLSSAISWAANHKLGFAGLGLIGGGFLVHRIIHDFEKKKFDRYMRNNPVKAENMAKIAIAPLMNEKIEKGFSSEWGLGKSNNTVITFRKYTTLGKQLKDTIELQALNGETITIAKLIDDETGGLKKILISSTANQITVTNCERKLESVAYADWARNMFVGIGAVVTLKSFIF